jgi:hypothetical protein
MLRTEVRLNVVPVLLLLAIAQACSSQSDITRDPRGVTSATTTSVLFSIEGSQDDWKAGISALQRADVSKDILQAVQAKDHRLIGIYGYALEIPGVEHPIPTGYIVTPIKGTSDFIASETQGRFQDLLHKYAEAYNRGVIAGIS